MHTSVVLARSFAKVAGLEKPLTVKTGQVKIAKRWLNDQDLVKLCRRVQPPAPPKKSTK